MPESVPRDTANHDSYDRSNDSESTPRSRLGRLQQALQGTHELVQDVWNMNDADHARGPTISPRHRRQRSPSIQAYHRPRYSNDVLEAESRHQPKRRRLTLQSPNSPKSAIKYGHYGQVQPGRLHLDIVSCDGGEHVDTRHPTVSLAAKNILAHDKSVYCSTRSACNIVLGHADDLPFNLEKLHIIAPEHGFTAPLRHGSIHIAMTLRALDCFLDPPTHARRSVMNPYSRPSLSSRDVRRQEPSERLSWYDALHDPEIAGALNRRERSRNEDRSDHDSSTPALSGPRVRAANQDDNEYAYPAPTQTSTDVDPELLYVPPWTISSDDDAGEEDTSSPMVIDFRDQRLRAMRRRYEIEDMDRDDRWNPFSALRENAVRPPTRDHLPYSSRLDAFMARTGQYDSSQLPDQSSSCQFATPRPDTVLSQSPSEVTSANFAIRQGHKIAIRFHPVVSGRYIMLKLQADKNNVDVQSVIAVGYGGQRFFPAKDFI